MKLSPIQLEAYALSDLAYRANQDHKPDQDTAYGEKDIVVEHKSERIQGDDRLWEASLSLRIQPRAEANAPYYISLQLSGLVRALPELQSDNIEQLMRVNGASLLYGVAREVVRQVTSMGPFAALLIPSVTFRPDPPAAAVLPEGVKASLPTPSPVNE
jgi:preprotein translocase subunit SecB